MVNAVHSNKVANIQQSGQSLPCLQKFTIALSEPKFPLAEKVLIAATVYRAGFYASFYGFLHCLRNIRKVEADYGFLSESDWYIGTAEERRNTARMNEKTAAKLWWQKLGQMIFENTMFLLRRTPSFDWFTQGSDCLFQSSLLSSEMMCHAEAFE